MIRRLNQQIKGWTMYHRYAASKRTFTYVDHRIFQMVWRWCRRRHPKKSRKWIKKKYFRQDGHRHWVFTGTAAGPERPGLADPVDGSSQGEDHSLCEDPQRRQSLRSGVGTVPGSTAGLATGPNAEQVAAGSNTSGRNKRDDVWSAVNRCGSQRRTARSTIGSGAAEAVRTRRTTWSCCMPTVIGRSTCKNDGPKRPRPARGVCEGLSWMKGNFHVQF